MARHRVSGSEHVSFLAQQHGFRDWQTIWNANDSLASRRQNPNIFFKDIPREGKAGDRSDLLEVPDHEPQQQPAATNQHHPHVTASNRLFLRLRILKDDFTAAANSEYSLTIDGVATPFTGRTNAQGQLEHEIPRESQTGTITVRVAPAPPPPPPPPASPPLGGTAPFTWRLQIGRLDPIMERAPDLWCIHGVQQRLNNLGISSGPVDGIKGRLTEAAIRVFQGTFTLGQDGKPGQKETQPKLVEVHDRPDSIAGPRPVPNDSQIQDTPEDAIGHVAPDFDDRTHFNTLRIRSTYRLTLRLGSIEELFPHAPGTQEGRMERMQVCGLFYYPMRQRRAVQAFNGIAAVGATAAVRGLWDYFKQQVMNNATDAEADAELQRMLREWVTGDSDSLPPAAADPAAPADANFRKLRLPGCYTLMRSWRSPAPNLNDDTAANYSNWTLGKNLYDVETQYLRDNAIMHKIPLIAKVERFDMTSGEWVVAPGATVYFQLIDPYPLPNFDPTLPVNAQMNRPPLRPGTLGPPANAAAGGPQSFANPRENPTGAIAPAATDPQRGNAHHSFGGKQGQGRQTDGSDVANIIFRTTSLRGFNAAHQNPAVGTVNPITRAVFFPLAQRVNDAARPHCVKAETNTQGEAGVIFTPSRCGGDRYRFRAFLGPPTLNGPGSDGTGAAAVRVESGTYVIWRHMRLSRYVQQPAAAVDPTLLLDGTNNMGAFVTNLGHGGGVNMNAIVTANDYLNRFYMVDAGGNNLGLPTCDMSFNSGTAGAFVSLPEQFSKSFVEVEKDRAAVISPPEVLSQADWQAARQLALADGQANLARVGIAHINLARLFYMDATAPATLNVTNAVVHLPMRTPADYNASLPAIPANQRLFAGANTLTNIQDLIGNFMLPAFFRSLSSNGYTPGLTVVQGAYGCTWVAIRGYSDSSGESLDYRGGMVWAGQAAYPTAPAAPLPAGLPWANYSMTSNTCHELGHVNFALHSNPPEPGSAPRHDPTANNLSVCVMSYQDCEGDFCSKCVFSFRGWDRHKLTY